MATELEKLTVQLSANIKSFENSMNRAVGISNSSASKIEKRIKSMGKTLSSSFAGLGVGKLAGLAAGLLTVTEITKAADAYTNLGNRLRALGVEGERTAQTQDEIVKIAIRARAPLESVGQLYTKLLSTTKELGVSQAAVGVATETISKGFILSGTSASEAASASQQLSQALASGVLRGDEFNSIMENSPLLAQAIAKEFGVTVSALRSMAEAGDLVSDRVFKAIIDSAPDIEKAFSKSIPTVEQALTNLGTSLATLVGKMDQTVGASQRVAGAFQAMANIINGLAINDPLAAAQARLKDAQQQLSGSPTTTNRVGQAMGGGSPATGRQRSALLVRVATEQANIERMAVQRINDGATAAVEQYSVDTQSGLDFGTGIAVPGAPTPTARPTDLGKKKTGGGSKIPARTADDRFGADIQATKDRTAALAEEQAMIGQGLVAQESRRVALELEQAALYDLREEARRKGEKDLESIALAPEQVAKIKEVSDAYAEQSVSLRKAQDAYGDINDIGRDAVGGLISDLRNGTSAAEALSNALDGVLDKLIDMALNSLFDPAGGNILGKIFGFSSGGSVGSGGIGHMAGGGKVRGPGTGTSDTAGLFALSNEEFVVKAKQAKKYRSLLEAINNGTITKLATGGSVGRSSGVVTTTRSGNSSSSLPITVVVEGARGNTEIQQMVRAGVQQGLGQYDKRLPGRIQDIQYRSA